MMSDSDEAAHRFTLVCAMLCYLATSREPQIEDAPAAAVEATAVVDEFIAAVRAEAVADVLAEQAKFVETATFHQTVGNYQYQVPGLSWSNAQAAAHLAAGSVPVATPTGIVRPDGVAYTTDEVAEIFVEQQHSLSVATPEPEWHNAYDCDAGLGDIHPQFVCERPYRVATPPAEPAEPFAPDYTVHPDPNDDLFGHLGLEADCPQCHPPAPSQPVTCDHGWTRAHCGTCIDQKNEVGPVSVPKESSE